MSALAAPRVMAAQAASPKPDSDACCVSIRLLTDPGVGKLGELFSVMEGRGDLSFSPVDNGKGLVPQRLWEREWGFTMGPVSSLEMYVCEHNRHICSITSKGPRWINQKAPPSARSIQGLRCDGQLPRWVVCLPTVQIDSYQETLVRRIDRSRKSYVGLGRLVSRVLMGCTDWDAACQKLVDNLNTARPEATQVAPSKYDGPIRLPFRALQIRIPARGGESFEALQTRGSALFEAFVARAAFSDAHEHYAVFTAEPKGGHLSQSQGVAGLSDGQDLSNAILRTLNYPYVTNAGRKARAALPNVVVGVWDKYVDGGHCAFQANGVSVVAYPDDDARTRLKPKYEGLVTPGGGCQSWRVAREPVVDHGTAVAGVIAALPVGEGPEGLNPRAQLWAADIEDLLASGPGQDPVTAFMIRSGTSVSVINVSQTMEAGEGTQFDRIMFGDGSSGKGRMATDIVVVAAAGNQGGRYTGAAGDLCPMSLYPACIGERAKGTALVTVTALNAAGTDILRCSDLTEQGIESSTCPSGANGSKPAVNFGDQFELAAPGVAVTTLYGDAFGVDLGTSFAAPRVASLASLLIAAVVKPASLGGKLRTAPAALDVRARMLATADPRRDGDGGGYARYGAINFGRALQFDADVVQLRDETHTACPPATSPCRLTSLTLNRNDGTSLTVETENGPGRTIPWRDVLRLQAIGDDTYPRTRYVVVFLEAKSGAAPREVAPPFYGFIRNDEKIRFSDANKAARSLYVHDLQEFTACAFQPICPSVLK